MPVTTIDATAVSTLRVLSARYIDARRTAGELRSRLAAVVRERAHATDQNGDASAADRPLAELERRRAALDRSTRTAIDRTTALEALIAAIALDPGARLRASDGSDNIGAAGRSAETGVSSTDALLELGGKVC